MNRDCASCGAAEGSVPGIETHNACSRCKITFYCGTECQKKHWKKGGHKLQCAALVEGGTEPKAEVGTKAATPSTAAPFPPAAGEKLCACCMDPLPIDGSDILQMPCSHHCHGECLRKLESLDVEEPCLLCCSKKPVPGPAQVHEKALRRFIVLHYRYSQGDDKPWKKIATADDRREMAEVLRLLRDAATQGNHADSQFNLGLWYARGEGVPRNDALAVKWLRKSACQGNARAQNNLGVLYRLGQGVPQSETTALEWFRKSAAQGLAAAAFSVGTSFLDGVEVPQNVAKAARYFLQAAEQGHAMAQYNLGVCYTHGRGVAQDEAAAAGWYRKAAEQGNARAQYDLGVLYANGEGVAQDLSESIRWLRRAEAQGDADAHEAIKAVMERARSQKKKAAAQPPPPVAVGARVELRGIKARPSDDVLNGQQGSVTAFNASTGRCSVQLDDGRGPINVKPENVKPLL